MMSMCCVNKRKEEYTHYKAQICAVKNNENV